jgi:hypothetical protein
MIQSNIDWILSSFCFVTDGVDMDHVLIVCATTDTTPLTIDPHRVVLFMGCYIFHPWRIWATLFIQYGIYRFFLILCNSYHNCSIEWLSVYERDIVLVEEATWNPLLYSNVLLCVRITIRTWSSKTSFRYLTAVNKVLPVSWMTTRVVLHPPKTTPSHHRPSRNISFYNTSVRIQVIFTSI